MRRMGVGEGVGRDQFRVCSKKVFVKNLGGEKQWLTYMGVRRMRYALLLTTKIGFAGLCFFQNDDEGMTAREYWSE